MSEELKAATELLNAYADEFGAATIGENIELTSNMQRRASDAIRVVLAALAKREAVAVELPAALVVTAEGSHHDYYAEGWNDCRRKVREILAASQQAAKGEGT